MLPVFSGKGAGVLACGEVGLRAAAAYETLGLAAPPPSSSARPFGVLACPLLQDSGLTPDSFFIFAGLVCFSGTKKQFIYWVLAIQSSYSQFGGGERGIIQQRPPKHRKITNRLAASNNERL